MAGLHEEQSLRQRVGQACGQSRPRSPALLGDRFCLSAIRPIGISFSASGCLGSWWTFAPSAESQSSARANCLFAWPDPVEDRFTSDSCYGSIITASCNRSAERIQELS